MTKITDGKTRREPWIRIVKKSELSPAKTAGLRISAFLLAILAGGLFILAIGYNPFTVYGEMVKGCFRTPLSIQSTVKIFIPLLITSLGVTLAFKMKFWNIGAEGQMIMGAIFASYFALFYSNLPHIVVLFIAFAAGAVGGGLWGLLPAFFKAKFNTNETLFTLMLNYIALSCIDLLQQTIWRDPSSGGFPKIATFQANSTLGTVFGAQGGWVLALLLMLLVYLFLKYTKSGYEISVVGESQATARYAGINVKKVLLSTMFLSGAISGIAGMIQVTGTDHTLSMGVAGGVGFTAIIVAWMGQLNPFLICAITAFFSILEKGSGVIQTSFGISTYAADVLQGVILFLILGCEFFIRYSFAFRSRKGGHKV